MGYTARVVKTLVLGAGVVGVTTAYFLAKAGHEVTILDERDGVGLEASAGNAGIIAPGHAFAWASPGAPRMLLESLRGAETAIRVRLGTRSAPVRVGAALPARVHGRIGRGAIRSSSSGSASTARP